MINTLLTSPLFGLNDSRMNSADDNADTNHTYLLYRINKKLEEQLTKQKLGRKVFIKDDEIRFAYTIEKCKIYRADLNDQRRALLNCFKEDIRSVLLENTDPVNQGVAIKTIVLKFIRDSNNIDAPFLAFRRFAITSQGLNNIIKEMNR